MITPSTTHQQTQMIVDSVEGIYQNTLTIAQSVTGDNLYGLYSCMVENSRGHSNRIEYFYGKTSNHSIPVLQNGGVSGLSLRLSVVTLSTIRPLVVDY